MALGAMKSDTFALLYVSIIMVFVCALGRYRYQSKQRRQAMTINAALRYCETGDLVLFRHRQTYLPQQVFLASEFSHVGIVIRDPVTESIQVFKSVNQGDLAALGLPNPGCYFVDFTKRLTAYDGYIVVKRLTEELPNAEDIISTAKTMQSKVSFNEDYRQDYVNLCVIRRCV